MLRWQLVGSIVIHRLPAPPFSRGQGDALEQLVVEAFGPNVDVAAVELDDGLTRTRTVPKAGRAQRPVHLNGSWERKTFLRVHEGDRVADRDVARRMLADAQPARDAQVLDGYGAATCSEGLLDDAARVGRPRV